MGYGIGVELSTLLSTLILFLVDIHSHWMVTGCSPPPELIRVELQNVGYIPCLLSHMGRKV